MWRIHFHTPDSEGTKSSDERSDHLEKEQETQTYEGVALVLPPQLGGKRVGCLGSITFAQTPVSILGSFHEGNERNSGILQFKHMLNTDIPMLGSSKD